MILANQRAAGLMPMNFRQGVSKRTHNQNKLSQIPDVKIYGKGRWRKRKGIADIEFENGTQKQVELHWYEATGIGRKEYKIKRFLK
jgi:hypothetical protein